ncbi:hypothetical protein [Desulfovibrio sp. JC010]|uniref:hypothetical protein n=1 Tax=Desulfovibrio sp. JC010 TaxID=2593641 RepID=UPI0013D1759F|nr:hypothetical protein [Desulfovibrio sp. JC010]NDV26733.1 hypothetical protein [Desulfovibrio sp. JC010]
MCKLKLLLLLLVFIIMTGCASRSTTVPAKTENSSTYLLKHSGVLSIADKRLPLRGMLQLKPEQKTARVVMMNDMGMKLLVAEIIADGASGFKSRKLFSSPFLRMIPPFYDESMRCIYAMYLAPQSAASSRSNIVTEGSKIIGNREFAAHTVISDPQGNYTLELFLNSGTQKDS